MRQSTLQITEATFEDSLVDPFNQATDELSFLSIDNSKIVNFDNKAGLRSTGILHFCQIDVQKQFIKRNSLDIWDLVADVGGFHDGLLLLVGLAMYPFSTCLYQQDVI